MIVSPDIELDMHALSWLVQDIQMAPNDVAVWELKQGRHRDASQQERVKDQTICECHVFRRSALDRIGGFPDRQKGRWR